MVARRDSHFLVVYSDEALAGLGRLSPAQRDLVREACESHAELAEVAPFSVPTRFGDELSFHLAGQQVHYRLDRALREFRVLRVRPLSGPG